MRLFYFLFSFSPDIIPSTKTSDSGRSVSDLESELRSEVEQRKKVENEKNTLNKEIQELFKVEFAFTQLYIFFRKMLGSKKIFSALAWQKSVLLQSK